PRAPGHIATPRDERQQTITTERSGSVVEHLQHVAREFADRTCRTKQAGMTGDASQCPCVVIVDIADASSAEPIFARGCRSRFPHCRWIELQSLNVAHLPAHRVELHR